MNRIVIMLVFWAVSFTATADDICNGLAEDALHQCLKQGYGVETKLSYKTARSFMFKDIDNVDGEVQLVYSGAMFKTNKIPNHTIVNTEHTWPQSKFKFSGIKTDLHHLFPTYNRINSKRGSHPFFDIPDNETRAWMNKNDQGKKQIPARSVRDEYSEWTNGKFEPREAHKGALARAMFYVYGIYGKNNVNYRWFKPQINTLLNWHTQYPVTEREIARSSDIKAIQGNENPFVLDPTLAYRIVGAPLPETADTTPLVEDVHSSDSSTLRIATWNIEHLSRNNRQGKTPREEEDYVALKRYASLLNADIIALQEVDGEEAAKRIFDSAEFDFHFAQGTSKQNVGFVVKKGIEWAPRTDLDALNVGRVRPGVRITLFPDEEPIELLGVHLKSFCFSQPRTSRSKDCKKHWKQVPIIEAWIDELASQSKAFIVLGDFNRRLSSDNDEVWDEWDDGQPDGLSLSLPTMNRLSNCWGGEYPDYIDHILGNDVQFIEGSFDQLVYDTDTGNELSDHCPISVEFRY